MLSPFFRFSVSCAACLEQYYFSPAGQRFRSRQEIVRHLETTAQQSRKVPREEAAANAKEAAEELEKQLPLTLDNGVTVARLAWCLAPSRLLRVHPVSKELQLVCNPPLTGHSTGMANFC